ncbi:hypothetical protein [Gulosibacter sp. 10]|uniref:hypothetical protein n=1 Tax=Gulosibacter sp. 10 TaxID=1255570 RepID=UPI00097ECBC1|nr:hypothetical protein [Gulosibacter sp. 10]SJM71266.1 hypothetical protein FM112_16020 [Gulosibacter sp. 10]
MIENRASGKLRSAAALLVLTAILAVIPTVMPLFIPPNVDPASMDVLIIVMSGLTVAAVVFGVIALVLILYGVAAHFEQQHEWHRKQYRLLEQRKAASASATARRSPTTEHTQPFSS